MSQAGLVIRVVKCALMEHLAKIVQKNVTVSTILHAILIAVHVHQELVNQDGLGNPVVKNVHIDGLVKTVKKNATV